MSKLTQEDIDFILYLRESRKKKIREIAESTGYSVTTVRCVCSGTRDAQNQKAKERYHARKKAKEEDAGNQVMENPKESDFEPIPGFHIIEAFTILQSVLVDCLPPELACALADAVRKYRANQ